jgi:hypothetical protein
LDSVEWFADCPGSAVCAWVIRMSIYSFIAISAALKQAKGSWAAEREHFTG